MFDYIKGNIVNKRVDYVTVDVNGIGYKIYISLNTYDKIKNSVEKLYIYNYVREDVFMLYGFYTELERTMFTIMLNASGIGPKLAIAILSTYDVFEIREFIITENINMLTKINGLGIKKAQKLILDIKDKVKDIVEEEKSGKDIKTDYVIRSEIILALESLGYNQNEINVLIENENFSEYKTTEMALKSILRKIKKQ